MAVDKPVQVKQPSITSRDAVTFSAGLDERGDYNAPINSYTYGRNAWVNKANNVTKRLGQRKWLPDTTGFNSELGKAYYNGQLYYFIADNGKIRYCKENDTAWTACGGSNTITTTTGVITTFLRTDDILLCMNGTDALRYVDLATMNVVVFTHVNDPTSTMTATATGITTTGSFKVYYGFTYTSDGGGQTAMGPILTQSVSKSRSTWKTDGTEYLTVAFNDTPPAGATTRNVFGAIAISGTTPQPNDLVFMFSVPIANTTFSDDGTSPFDIAVGLGPDTNSTGGVKASAGIMAGNTPVLYSDPDNPYNIYFVGKNNSGISFSEGDGAQTLPLSKGTNFYPTSVVGLRNNQGVPSLLALSSSVDGVAKQHTLTQKTITYGNQAKQYWDSDELNIGASAVYAKYAVVNFLGKLLFPSANGINSIDTAAQIQNKLSADIVSNQISNTYSTIKNAEFDKIVGTPWNNYAFFTVPSQGYNYNNQILVYDLTNQNEPKWAVWDKKADWIGTVSPPNQASFLYIRQGTKIFKLIENYVAEDEDSTGVSTAFPVDIQGSLIPFADGRNYYVAASQGVFYVANFIGTITCEVTYINQKGKPKTKSKTFTNGTQGRNALSGWSNPRNLWRSWNTRVINWSTPIPMSGDTNNALKETKRLRVKLPNPIVNEVKFRIYSNLENTSFDLVKFSLEKSDVGIIGDIV